MPDPAYLDSTQQLYASTTTVSVPKPTLVDGCTVIFVAWGRGNNPMLTPPSGANGEAFEGVPEASVSTGSTSTAARLHVSRHYVTTAADEPSTYAAVMSAGLNGGVAAVSMTGLDPIDPIDIGLTSSDTTGSDASITCPSVTPTKNNTLIIRIVGMNTSVGVDSWAPTTSTEVEDLAAAANRNAGAIGWATHATAGTPTGTEVWTATMTGGSTTYGSMIAATLAFQATGDVPPPIPDPPPIAVEGRTLGDLKNAWRRSVGAEEWGDYVAYIHARASGATFADASFLYWQEQAGLP